MLVGFAGPGEDQSQTAALVALEAAAAAEMLALAADLVLVALKSGHRVADSMGLAAEYTPVTCLRGLGTCFGFAVYLA